MGKYAKNTDVPAERTKVEIETMLRRYGADRFVSGWQDGVAAVSFNMRDRMVRFHIPMPQANEYHKDHNGRPRSKENLARVLAKEERQRWRAMLLVIKAKLEAVESGISQFEEEFMAHIVLPNGSTVGQFMKPQIESAYATGKMPLQLGFDK